MAWRRKWLKSWRKRLAKIGGVCWRKRHQSWRSSMAGGWRNEKLGGGGVRRNEMRS